MKKYLRRIYLNQPQKITTIIVFVFLIILCLLPLFVNINSISSIKLLFDQYGTIINWVTTILVVVLPQLLKFILSEMSASRSRHIPADPLSESRNEDFAGIITKTDLEQRLSVKELLTGSNVRVGNQEYRLTQDTIRWLQEQQKLEITALDFLKHQRILFERDLSGFINAVERIFSSGSSREIILTGKSGCGKSLFISMFKLSDQHTYDVSFFEPPYTEETRVFKFISEAAGKTNGHGKKVLIFDQFEKALSNPDLTPARLADELKRAAVKNVILVYVLREDKVAGLFSRQSNVAIPVYSLSIQDTDVEQLESKCRRYLDLSKTDFDNMLKEQDGYGSGAAQVMIPLLNGVIKGNIPLVAFELVCSIIANSSLTFFDQGQGLSTAELSSNPEKIMYYYFNEWVKQFDDPRSGLAILYYLSDYSAHRDEDIRNISFCMSIQERQMTKFGLINSYSGDSPSFEFAHNYLADVAKHYCKDSKDFSETIAENIDFYREAATFPATYVRTESKKRTANYWSKKNRFLVNVCLNILLIGSGVVCVHHSLSLFMSPNTWMVFTLTAILINCLLSTLYIYSFCVDYLIIYGGLTVLPLTAYGAVSIILAIAFPNHWAILLSIESFILAGTVFFTSRIGIQKKAIRSFTKTASLITAFSIITAFLGVVYLFFFNGFHVQTTEGYLIISIEDFSPLFRGILELSYYGLYFAVIISSFSLHCLTSYLFERVGLANRFVDEVNLWISAKR